MEIINELEVFITFCSLENNLEKLFRDKRSITGINAELVDFSETANRNGVNTNFDSSFDINKIFCRR